VFIYYKTFKENVGRRLELLEGFLSIFTILERRLMAAEFISVTYE